MAKKKRVSLRNKYKKDYDNKDDGYSNSKKILDLSNHEEVSFYKMKEDDNEIDIIPYLVTSDNHPDSEKNGGDLVPKQSYDYFLDVWVHRFIGPANHNFLCMKKTYGKSCFVCEEIERMVSADMLPEKEESKIKAKHRVLYNVLDVLDENEEDKGVQIFEVSFFEFQKKIIELAENPGRRFDGEVNDDGFVCFAELEDGYTIGFKGTERTFDKKKSIKPENFSFYKRDPYNEGILEEVYPLDAMLIIPNQDEIERLMLDKDEENEEEKDTVEETETRKSKISRRKRTRREKEEVEDNPVEEEEESKENSRKSRKKRSKCPHEYEFGADCEEKDECNDCDVWDECVDEKDRLNEDE